MANKNENLKWAIENDIYIEPQILDYSNRGVYGIFVEDECVYIGRATSLYRRIFQSRGHVRKMRYSEHVSKLMQGLQDKKKISIKVLEIVKEDEKLHPAKNAQRLNSRECYWIDEYQKKYECLEQYPEGNWGREKNN